MLTNKFKKTLLEKLLYQLISVKVWFLIAILIISTLMCTQLFITGSEWVSLNTVIVTAVLGSREAVKIAERIGGRGKAYRDDENIDDRP